MTINTDYKYLAFLAPRLSVFKKKTERLYNFRCPFCGDSKKNKYKARGFVFEIKGSLAFKCHNCNFSCSLDKLIEHVDPLLHKEYRLENFREKKSFANNFIIKNTIEKEEPEMNSMKLDLPILTELPETNPAVEYAKLRRLPKDRWNDLYYCENMKSLEYLNEAYKDRLPDDQRLIIPFRNKKGMLTGVTGRSLSNSKLRYATLRINNDPLVYGLNIVNPEKTTYVVEGQIDSMFIENCIAPGGTDFERAIKYVQSDKTVLVFDNQPRNKQVVYKIEKMISKQYKVVIFPKEWNYKDINEAIMRGITKNEIMRLLNKNTYSGLSANLAIREWKRI